MAESSLGWELFLPPGPDPACIAYALAHEVSQQHQKKEAQPGSTGSKKKREKQNKPENTLHISFQDYKDMSLQGHVSNKAESMAKAVPWPSEMRPLQRILILLS